MPEFVETLELVRDIVCKYCGNTNLCLNGSQNGEQYYLCKNCGHRATGKDTYPHQRYDIPPSPRIPLWNRPAPHDILLLPWNPAS